MNQKIRSLLCALPAVAGFASAQIDSGGGKAAVGGSRFNDQAEPPCRSTAAYPVSNDTQSKP